MAEEMEEVEAVEIEAAPVVEETPEQRDERLKREDYERRVIQANKDREDVFRRNGLLKPDESLTLDVEANIRQRCCF